MEKRVAQSLYREAIMMRGDLEKIEPETEDLGGARPSGISGFLKPFNGLLFRAIAALDKDRIATQSLAQMVQVETFDENLSVASHKKLKFTLMLGLGRVIALVEPFVVEGSAPALMRATREGVFFGGEYYEPFRLAADLIAQAKHSIGIIDGYLGQPVLDLLAGKAAGVTVSILTFEERLEPPLVALAQAFQKEHGGLSLRTSRAFHDRFIIIDDTEFYHFGASLKDMGTRGFMFSRIEEPEVIEKVRTKFSEEWARAAIKI